MMFMIGSSEAVIGEVDPDRIASFHEMDVYAVQNTWELGLLSTKNQ